MKDTPVKLAHVVACDQDNGIGKQGDLAWHIKEDLQHFKALTSGGVLFMGRTTFESLPGLLPNREHVVLTKNAEFAAAGAHVETSLESALTRAKQLAADQGQTWVWVIGGAQIYQLTLPLISRFEVTRIKGTHGCDAFYPKLPKTAVLTSTKGAEDSRIAAFETYELDPLS